MKRSSTGTAIARDMQTLPSTNVSIVGSTEVWPLVVYFLVVVALVGGLMAFSHVLGERHSAQAADEPYESGIVSVGDARVRFPAKFYLMAVFFVIFDVESLFIFAWAIAFREAGWAGYVEMLIFILILVAALAYLWRLGALELGSPGRRPSPGNVRPTPSA
jgi:NADH-quinone oxidoreductase subunit A